MKSHYSKRLLIFFFDFWNAGLNASLGEFESVVSCGGILMCSYNEMVGEIVFRYI
jgi:hypothetical protein